MTQALSFSMLMLGADSTLKSDGTAANGASAESLSQSDTELGGQGSGFSALLNGMVQPANNGKAGVNLRQNPAAVSGLSAISMAMLQAAEQEAASAEDVDAALANSLLLQIALNTQKKDAGQTMAQSTADETDVDAVSEAEAQLLSESDTDSTAKSAQTTQQYAAVEAVSKPGGVAENILGNSAAAEESSAAIANTGGVGDVTDNTLQATANIAPETVVLPQNGDAEEATLSNPESETQLASVQQQRSEKTPASEQHQVAVQTSAALNEKQSQIVVSDAELATQGQNQIQSAAASSASNTSAEQRANDADNNSIVAAKTPQANGAAALASEPVTMAITSQAAMAANRKTDDKTQTTYSDANKVVTVKAEPSSMVKAAIAEQGAQQQHQDQSQAERQLSTLAQLNASGKAATDPVTARVENSFAASLQAAESRPQMTSSAVTKAATEQLKQSLNLQQHDAASQMRERVNLMVRQNIQIAEIRLDPAGLGQMQIKVDMQQDQTNVQFIVQQPQAKELLEQQLPRLREMLQQQGIVLGEGSVQQQSQQERQLAERQQQQGGQGHKPGSSEDGADDNTVHTQLKVAPADRLVDYYA